MFPISPPYYSIPTETQDKLICMQDFGIMGNMKMVKRKKHQLPRLLTAHFKIQILQECYFLRTTQMPRKNQTILKYCIHFSLPYHHH